MIKNCRNENVKSSVVTIDTRDKYQDRGRIKIVWILIADLVWFAEL